MQVAGYISCDTIPRSFHTGKRYYVQLHVSPLGSEATFLISVKPEVLFGCNHKSQSEA